MPCARSSSRSSLASDLDGPDAHAFCAGRRSRFAWRREYHCTEARNVGSSLRVGRARSWLAPRSTVCGSRSAREAPSSRMREARVARVPAAASARRARADRLCTRRGRARGVRAVSVTIAWPRAVVHLREQATSVPRGARGVDARPESWAGPSSAVRDPRWARDLSGSTSQEELCEFAFVIDPTQYRRRAV
jgi:hypothetical protein